MACRTLNVIDEVFGPAFEPPVAPKPAVRGEWSGLQVNPTSAATTPVAGINIRTQLTSGGSPSLVVTVAMGGGAEKSAQFLWATPSGTQWTQVIAGRFTTAEFMVVRYTASGSSASAYQATYAIFDIRPRAAGAAVPEPIILGPFDLPSAVEQHFCTNASGQLVLLWHGTSGPVGRKAVVYRTEILQGVTKIQPLVSGDFPMATGTIACKITKRATTGADIALYDQAFRQGLIAVSLSAPSQLLATVAVPQPGQLDLSARTLSFAVGDTTEVLQISNAGRDYLEVTSVTAPGTAVTLTPNLPLPTCLLPDESLSVTVKRVGSGAGSTTIAVATVPAAASGANTVAVTFAASVAKPAVDFSRVLTWRAGEPLVPKDIVVHNTGTVVVDVAVPAPAAGSAFTWTAISKTALGVDAKLKVQVTPPPAGPAPVHSTLAVDAFLTGTMTRLAGFPAEAALHAGISAKVAPGALRITTILADAPGNDILPEGEFIEFTNVSNAPVDLTGCVIEHQAFAPGSRTGNFQTLFTFGPNVFGADSVLPPVAGAGPTVRVLTRARASVDPTDPFRIFAGRGVAAWNNSGDTGRIKNDLGDVVDTFAYVLGHPSGGAPVPPGTVVYQPRARHRALVRRVFVDTHSDWTSVFMVEEGDLVNITATGNAHFGGFAGGNGWAGPEGQVGNLAPPGFSWPLEGAPVFSLIGNIGGGIPFSVGLDEIITNNRSGGPFMLSLGPNDGETWDNNGSWDVVAVLYR